MRDRDISPNERTSSRVPTAIRRNRRRQGAFEQQTRHYLDCAQQYVLALARCAGTEGSVFRKGGVSAPTSSGSFKGRIASLTPKQRRTLSLLLTGCPNKVIAYELGVTESAIKAHVTAILCKLQVRNRAQVIAAAAPLERFESLQLETTLAPGGRSAMSGPAPNPVQRDS